MGFNRQLNGLVVALGTLVTFVGCIFLIGIPVKISLLIAACVFFGGLFLGRRFVQAVIGIFS
jgi:hypothetical protein